MGKIIFILNKYKAMQTEGIQLNNNRGMF